MSMVAMFPPEWFVDVTVLRSEGRDPKGNPTPALEIPATRCAVAPRSTAEPNNRSEVVDSTAVLYRDHEPGFVFLPGDRVRISPGDRMAGEWKVEGRPGEWPDGWEVGLVTG